MNINKFLKSIFGDKASRDMKTIRPLVEKVKAAYPAVKALSNDELRAKTQEIRQQVRDAAKQQREEIARLKSTIEDTPIDQRESIFNQIDKLEKEALDRYEEALNEVMPVAFSIVKDTARRFAENEETIVTATDFDRELAADPTKDFVTIDGDKAIYHNHWTAGGNDLKWEMVHYDVQIFGGEVLHQGKIAEMATGEGKTLVATLPVFLNALTGNGVHVVTVNDYLAKRDSEWMGPLYEFNGLSVDCIDKHQPNSEERRRAYQADITFGTNNEFGFDYLRDNMAMSPADLVQRQHLGAVEVIELLRVRLVKRVAEHRLRRVPEHLVVQAVHAAEVRDAGLGGHTGAAEKHDVVRAVCQLFQSADGIVHTVLHFFCKERLS